MNYTAIELMDAAIASALNDEGVRTSHGQRFSGPMIHLLRKRRGFPLADRDGIQLLSDRTQRVPTTGPVADEARFAGRAFQYYRRCSTTGSSDQT